MLTAAASGLLTGLALIVAIGAQNAFVLRQGLAGRYVGPVVAICALSDLALILAGVAGVGALIEQAGWVVEVVRWLGVGFLVTYAVLSLRSALGASSLEAARAGAESLGAAVTTALALTWLNPHVYLDTVLFLGSVANQHADRWWFALGASAGSLIWFTGLGYGARLCQGVLSSARAWQVLDVLIALTMLGIAVMLALG